MKKRDGRKLKKEAQQELRYSTIELFKLGIKQNKIAEMLGISLAAIKKFIRIYKIKGKKGLILKKRGVKQGTNKKLNFEQSEFMKQLIINKTPDKIGLDKLLWTRKTIQFAAMQLLNVFMPLSTISYYMKNFGFSLQKPLKKAYEQNPKAVEDWIKKDYLEIKAKAKKEDAEIHWVDETGLRSNSNYIRGYSPKGKTPIIKNSAKRFGINIISSITNQGKMRFKTYKGSMNSQTLVSFMSRLYSRNKHKIFVILDNLSVHHSKYFKNWLKNKKEKIEVFYLPPYSPELNPDERLNRDLKTNFNFGFNIKNSDDLRKKVRSFLRRIQKTPERIKKYFISNFVRYAA